MTRFLQLAILLLGCGLAAALTAWPVQAANTSQPRLIEVQLHGSLPANALIEAGLDVVQVERDRAWILEWPHDRATIARLGLSTTVLDDHPGKTAARRASEELRARGVAATRSESQPPMLSAPPVGSGSLGGYWTLGEIKMKLDELVASDANDVVADKLDTLGHSLAGRPIWGLKLGKAVSEPDPRPIVFYNALTHAREPAGMQALMYFVEDILERYGSDAFATYLLDHRVLYVCPVVNPDGYMINDSIYVATGEFGLWRKNARDNDTSGDFGQAQDGVDLNRNYGYQWGLDDFGSSPLPQHPTYRGTAPFSEPETQIQRDIVSQLAPKTGQSFHSFGDVAIHPWGWTGIPAPDLDKFREWSDELTRENGYQADIVANTLGYIVNGEFNDWAYGDTTKPKIYSWTPEVGSDVDFFWPPPSRILPLAQENLRIGYVTAAIAGAWPQVGDFTILDGHLNASYGGRISVRARNLGLAATGPVLLGHMTPLDPGVRMLTDTVQYPTLGSLTSGEPFEPFQLVVDDTVTAGRLLRFLIEFTDPGGLYARDTIVTPCGTPTVLVVDDASAGFGQWTSGDWGIVTDDPAHPSAYFTDSPGDEYPIFSDNSMSLNATLDLSGGLHAYAFYEARWDIERNYDAARFEASLDGSAWTSLWASGSTASSGLGTVQTTAGLPVYSGSRWLWKPEIADLSAFTGAAGSAVHLRFRLQSDIGLDYEGFSFDSLRVLLYEPSAQPPIVAVGEPGRPATLVLSPASPNPARGATRLTFALPHAGHVALEILDVQGRRVRTLADGALPAAQHVRTWDLRDHGGHNVTPGIYFARLRTDAGVATQRFVVVR